MKLGVWAVRLSGLGIYGIVASMQGDSGSGVFLVYLGASLAGLGCSRRRQRGHLNSSNSSPNRTQQPYQLRSTLLSASLTTVQAPSSLIFSLSPKASQSLSDKPKTDNGVTRDSEKLNHPLRPAKPEALRSKP